jgi:hypothetical protein
MQRQWPEWWDWELELSPHLLKRMIDRSFTEPDLRAMLEHARAFKPDTVEGRWVIVTVHHRRVWEVIVEPDPGARRIVVITAYRYSRA